MKSILAVPAALLAAGCLLAAAPLTRRPLACEARREHEGRLRRPGFRLSSARPGRCWSACTSTIDGRPLQAAWDDFIDHLFTYLDVNGDGVLSKEEFAADAAAADPVQQQGRFCGGGVAASRGSPPDDGRPTATATAR